MTDPSGAGPGLDERARQWFVEHLGALGVSPAEVDGALQNGTLTARAQLCVVGPDARHVAHRHRRRARRARREAPAGRARRPASRTTSTSTSSCTTTSRCSRRSSPVPRCSNHRCCCATAACSATRPRVAEGSVSLFLRTTDTMSPSPVRLPTLRWNSVRSTAIRVFRDSVPKTVERMMLHHFVIVADRFAAMRDGQHTVEAAVGFVDLTDSTGLTSTMAPAPSTRVAAFEMTAADAAASRGGRLVKLIGDAATFIAAEAEDAVAATVEIVDRGRRRRSAPWRTRWCGLRRAPAPRRRLLR